MGAFFDEILKDPSKVSTAVLAIAAVYALITGKIVPRWTYDVSVNQCSKLEKERDEFKDMALRNIALTDRALDVAQKKNPA